MKINIRVSAQSMSLLDGRSKVCFSQKREMEGGSKNEKMLKKYKQSKLHVYMSYTFPKLIVDPAYCFRKHCLLAFGLFLSQNLVPNYMSLL